MRNLPLLIVFGALLALTSGAKVDPQPPPESTSVTPSTSHPPPVTTTTVAPTTEPTKPTSPPTPPPTKPTLPPTPPPTTKPPPTPPPTTKPTTAPTTPPAPTPSPKPPTPPQNIPPETGDWNVTYNAVNTTGACIITHMAIQFEVPYHTKTNETWHAYVDIPKNATVTGNCDPHAESLTLTWVNGSVVFNFVHTENKTWYAVDKLTVNLSNVNFPNMDNNRSVVLVYSDAKPMYNVTEKMSYKCAQIRSFNLTTDGGKEAVGFMHVSHLQLQAFGAPGTKGFADAIDCEPAGTPDIVPIAAGVALAALILIVLGAYLIGRRRSQARGYLSM